MFNFNKYKEVYNGDKSDSIIAMISSVRRKHPELRVAQIVSNAARYGGWDDPDLFYCPDSALIKGLGVLLAMKGYNEK